MTLAALPTFDVLKKLCGNKPPYKTLASNSPFKDQERGVSQEEIHEAIWNDLPRLQDRLPYTSARPMDKGDSIEWDKLVPPDAWFGQLTGSCVGTNGANVLLSQVAVENIVQKTGELLHLNWWWPYSYGWGRYFGGMTNEGEGSWLSVQYRAFKEKGIPDFDDPGLSHLPKFRTESGARWLTSKIELKWSARRNIDDSYDEYADDNRVIEGAMIKTKEEVDLGLDTGPLGIASMLGSNRIYTKEGVKLSDWSAEWAHNMGIVGKQNHPKLGMLYKILNYSWLPSEYAWFWITEKTLNKVIKDGGTEIMKIANFDGLPGNVDELQELIQFIMSL